MSNWQVTDRDRELWDRELELFVPPRIFDAHLHLYEQGHFRGQPPALCDEGPISAGWSEYQRQIGQIMPRRQIDGLAFGFPATAVDFETANGFVAAECRQA